MQQRAEDLPDRLAADLDRSFASLVTTYQHQLYTFALRQAGSPEEAEDLVGNYPPQRVRSLKLRPWLYKITLNVFYSRARRPGLAQVPLDDDEESLLLEIEDASCERPDELLERLELRGELSALLGTLPTPYREALVLYYFEGFSYQEIADLLGHPLGTIKARMSRGLQLLRKALGTRNAR